MEFPISVVSVYQTNDYYHQFLLSCLYSLVGAHCIVLRNNYVIIFEHVC